MRGLQPAVQSITAPCTIHPDLGLYGQVKSALRWQRIHAVSVSTLRTLLADGDEAGQWGRSLWSRDAENPALEFWANHMASSLGLGSAHNDDQQ